MPPNKKEKAEAAKIETPAAPVVAAEAAAAEVSYFQKRMTEIGITASNLNIKSADASGTVVERPMFTEDEEGNIVIHFYDFRGNPYTYHPPSSKWSKPYTRTRFKSPRIGADGKLQKYTAASGTHNCIYFTDEIRKKYQAGIEIPLLIMTEGEFKTLVACMAGLDIVGCTGIQNWADPNNKKHLHHALIDLLVTCKVKRFMYLTDADTMEIKHKPDDDLTQRPNFFYSAMKDFREAVMTVINTQHTFLKDVYYGHIKTEFAKSNQKGLDDLIIAQRFNIEKIKKSANDTVNGGE